MVETPEQWRRACREINSKEKGSVVDMGPEELPSIYLSKLVHRSHIISVREASNKHLPKLYSGLYLILHCFHSSVFSLLCSTQVEMCYLPGWILPTHEVSKYVHAIQVGVFTASVHIATSHWLAHLVGVRINRQDIICEKKKKSIYIYTSHSLYSWSVKPVIWYPLLKIRSFAMLLCVIHCHDDDGNVSPTRHILPVCWTYHVHHWAFCCVYGWLWAVQCRKWITVLEYCLTSFHAGQMLL